MFKYTTYCFFSSALSRMHPSLFWKLGQFCQSKNITELKECNLVDTPEQLSEQLFRNSRKADWSVKFYNQKQTIKAITARN